MTMLKLMRILRSSGMRNKSKALDLNRKLFRRSWELKAKSML